MKPIAVIGAGFAGLVAAARLAEQGRRVIVLEARPRLGGRAYSFADEESGETIDNGQHAMMGCYHRTLAFLERIGAGAKIYRQPSMRVEMVHRERGAGTIAFGALPSPLHALGGIARYDLLDRAERVRALLGGMRIMAMRRRKDARLHGSTVERVLVGAGQSARARECFWYPVAIATLNERPERAAAAPFAEVLARAFFGSRRDSQFVLPRVGLSELYTEDARRFIERHGGSVETKSIVAGLCLDEDRVKSLRLRDGRELEVEACISAVPPRALLAFLPEPLRAAGPFAGLGAIDTSPIVSVHLRFDRPVLSGPFVGLLGTTTQFAFNRTMLLGNGNGDGQQAVSTVVSAGRELVECDNAGAVGTVTADLRSCLAAARTARLLGAQVVKEKHATISLTPEADRLRPGVRTPLHNLFLAGDWIQTGLPATIESAVISGERAAAAAGARS